jgi:hypothetical protein
MTGAGRDRALRGPVVRTEVIEAIPRTADGEVDYARLEEKETECSSWL